MTKITVVDGRRVGVETDEMGDAVEDPSEDFRFGGRPRPRLGDCSPWRSLTLMRVNLSV